jgi:hypothetical protein
VYWQNLNTLGIVLLTQCENSTCWSIDTIGIMYALVYWHNGNKVDIAVLTKLEYGSYMFIDTIGIS